VVSEQRRNVKANIMIPINLPNNTRGSRTRFPFLKHVNAGTLAVVMMVSMALLDATRRPSSATGMSTLNNTLIDELATDVPSLGIATSTHPSELYRENQRTMVGLCSGLSRRSACLP